MRKRISLFIVFIILFSCINCDVFAEERPILEIVTTESLYRSNQSTDIKLYLNNAYNVVTASCTVEYDSDMMAVMYVAQSVPEEVEIENPKFPPILEKVSPGEMILKLNDSDNCGRKEFSYVDIIPKKDGKTTVTITDIIAYDIDGNEIEVDVLNSSAELSFKLDFDFSFNPETKTLNINGTGGLPDYFVSNEYEYSSLAPYSEYVNEIKHVVIGEGIVSIGDFEFTDSVKSVQFPDSLESMGLTDLSASGDQIWYGKAFSVVEKWASLAKQGIPINAKNISFIANDISANGDLNRDNVINASDALFILKISAKLCEESGCLFTPDVNKDGKVNAEDALLVLKIAAKILV